MDERSASKVLEKADKTSQTLLPNVMFVAGPAEAAAPSLILLCTGSR